MLGQWLLRVHSIMDGKPGLSLAWLYVPLNKTCNIECSYFWKMFKEFCQIHNNFNQFLFLRDAENA